MALSKPTIGSICNLALSRLGVTDYIQDLNTDSDEGEACAQLYPHSLRYLLEMYPWPWAMKRADLTQVEDFEHPEWGYAYTLPADCLVVRRVTTGSRKDLPENRVEYDFELTADGKYLLCDEETVEIFYTASHEIVELYPAHFVDALAWHLASELAMALAIKGEYEVRARKRFEDAVARAATISISEPEQGEEPQSGIISARGE